MRRRWLAVGVLLLAGCAAQPPVPDWRLDLRQAVEQGRAAELEARDRVAALHWARAQRAARSAADPQALARVALVRCALRLAAAQPGACPSAEPYLEDAGAVERAYAAWLAGAAPAAVRRGADKDVNLPAAPQALAVLNGARGATDTLTVLRGIDDPLSRLVAGGWLWQAGQLDADGVRLMVETAAAQGWRRPLAAWLAVQRRWAERRGDATTAGQAERRLRWLGVEQAVAADQAPDERATSP
ncbi:hypothetical protein Talka_00782 [Tepidimonas alkaliphilus]|uniref:Lipoprotein n=1 Tax=Tepidimonas alkaliphilus TaxID=2588942 RepID=A0A554WA37_9BURK|nr:hypothetical protein [Tepidimonas alkaliphilus]TSE20436.1 hypothetical protein Talka_00782 [Tepidimonas alkaliphilus]